MRAEAHDGRRDSRFHSWASLPPIVSMCRPSGAIQRRPDHAADLVEVEQRLQGGGTRLMRIRAGRSAGKFQQLDFLRPRSR